MNMNGCMPKPLSQFVNTFSASFKVLDVNPTGFSGPLSIRCEGTLIELVLTMTVIIIWIVEMTYSAQLSTSSIYFVCGAFRTDERFGRNL